MKPIAPSLRTLFTQGYCAVLALALHERTGWPLMVESDPLGGEPLSPELVRHVWVLNPQGRAVDAGGIHPDGVGAVCDLADVGPVHRVTAAKLRRLQAGALTDGRIRARANALLDRRPDYFGLL